MSVQIETTHLKRHRRSIRLEGYDYASEGGYFVTIVTYKRIHLFGKVVDREMHLNEFGRIVREEWFKTCSLRPNVELLEDEFVVMPNHIHGIIWLFEDNTRLVDKSSVDDEENKYRYKQSMDTIRDSHGTGDLQVARTRPKGPFSESLGAIIAGYKSAVTTRINTLRQVKGQPVWLRNYYEHIISTEKEYENIANYIDENPRNWELKDEYYI